MESPQQHQHGGESIVLHTFYTGRAKISTKTFERGVQPEKNCGNFRTKSVNDQPGDPTQPRQMETSPEAGQSILVQPLAGAEPLYSPPQRTAAHGAASGDGSMGLHRCRAEPVLVAGDDCWPLASGISRKETALHFDDLSIRQKETVSQNHTENAFCPGIPTITAFSQNASSPSGRKKYASGQESATGRETRCTAA